MKMKFPWHKLYSNRILILQTEYKQFILNNLIWTVFKMELLLCKECRKYYIEKEKGIAEKIKNGLYSLGGRIMISIVWAFMDSKNRKELYNFLKKHAGGYDDWCPRCIKREAPAFSLEFIRIIENSFIKKA